MKKVSEGIYRYKDMLIEKKQNCVSYIDCRNGRVKTARGTYWEVSSMGHWIGSFETLRKAKQMIEEVQDET